jgi:Tol biopolymer transport system component
MTQSTHQQIAWSFSGDGKRMAFVELNSASRADIWTLPVETSSSGLRAGKPEVFLQTPFNERGPAFSPDGRWIAYQSNESGRYEVYVQAFPDGHGKRQISAETSGNAAWSRDGHELFFLSFGAPRNQLMAASYKVLGDSFVADKPRVWSEKKPLTFTSTRSYDPAPDANGSSR